MCEFCFQLTPQLAVSPLFGVLEGAAAGQHLAGGLPLAGLLEGADAAGDTGTAYSIGLGDSFEGRVGSGTDTDWVEISLTEGDKVVLTAFGTNGTTSGLDDTILALYDGSGTQVALNDDAFADGGNHFSLIEYTVPATGSYYIEVSSYGQESGDYILRTATNEFRIGDIVSQLTEFGWGIPTAIAHDERSGETVHVYIANLTAQGQVLALQALEQWAAVTGISFAVTTNSAGADIRFDDDQAGAFAGPSSLNPNTGVINFADVNVGTGWLASYGTTVDSYSFQTYMHEIGHALGLMHAGNYDGSATWGSSNHYTNDTTLFTIMSYFDMVEAGVAPHASIITPMIADIAAVWALYGVPAAVYEGSTTWFANNTLGGLTGEIMAAVWDGASVPAGLYSGAAVALTVLDTGGIDTFDLSTVSVAQVIDLREGEVSLVGRGLGGQAAMNSLVIALGTVIENVIGGAGADTIIGNGAANSIAGGAGADRITASLGDDSIDGGSGNDTVIYGIASGGITVADMGGGTIRVTSSLGSDSFAGIEFYEFTDTTLTAAELVALATLPPEYGGPVPDAMEGSAGADELHGLGGNDWLDGLAGNDRLFGGDGDDAILGRDGDDYIEGGAGNDNMPGAQGNDEIHGGLGHDRLGGGTGNDLLYGGDGNDWLGGGPGHDRLEGGSGNDRMSASYGDDVLIGGDGHDHLAAGPGADRVEAGAGDDSIGGGAGIDLIHCGSGNDMVGGGDGADSIWGDGGDDTLNGGVGNDVIDGGTGADRINGGAGDDTMTGGAGADVFVFATHEAGERDVIADFDATGIDSIRISGVSGASDAERFDSLNATRQGDAVTLTHDGHVMVLELVALADLDAGDFSFV